MRIDGLQLYHFRNYDALSLTPDEGLCVLTGPNGAGKTNVLEAVFLCAFGRSHRTPRDADLIKKSQEEAGVKLRVCTRGGRRQVRVELTARERKKVYLDGGLLSRSGELMGCLNVVMFSPSDLALVQDGPAERRRFMDMELSQLKPAYYYSLQQYNQALKQRNNLLKVVDREGLDTLAQWDEQLSLLGAAITAERANFVRELTPIAARRHRSMCGAEELLVGYEQDLPPVAEEQLQMAMRDALADALEKDLYRGYTSVGPHRDDLSLQLDGLDARVYGSQGQQRSAALSLKLSEIDLIERIRGEKPVLLLDDVFSELDTNRQKRLLESVEGCQAFISCTQLEPLTRAGAERMQVLAVRDGAIVEV